MKRLYWFGLMLFIGAGCVSTSSEPAIVQENTLPPAPIAIAETEAPADGAIAATEEPADVANTADANPTTALVLANSITIKTTVEIISSGIPLSSPLTMTASIGVGDSANELPTLIYQEAQEAQTNAFLFSNINLAETVSFSSALPYWLFLESDSFPFTCRFGLNIGQENPYCFQSPNSPLEYIGRITPTQMTADYLELAIEVFGITSAAEDIRFSEVWYIVDPSPTEGTVNIAEWYFFTNTSDRIYIAPDNSFTGLQIALPREATNLVYQSGTFSLQTQGETSVIVDNRITLPESPLQLQVNYVLPYDNTITLTRLLPHPADEVSVYVATTRLLTFNGDNFLNDGQVPIVGLGEYDKYIQGRTSAAGDTITFTIAEDIHQGVSFVNAPATIQETNSSAETGTTANWLLVVGGGLMILGGVYFVYDLYKIRRGKRQPNTSENHEELVQAIAALDAAYEAGEIADEDYQTKREALRTQLRERLR